MARILLVDDEEYVRLLYAEELAEENHQVFTAATGHNLLRKNDHLQPEVVIFDVKLFDYNGLELLQEIRSFFYDLPVILCTAYDTYKYDPKALAADYYVIKSFYLSELKMTIRRSLEADSSPRLRAL